MGRVVVLGSLNLDLVTQVERHPEPGETVLGEGLDGCRRQGRQPGHGGPAAGADVAMVGCVGDDDGGAPTSSGFGARRRHWCVRRSTASRRARP